MKTLPVLVICAIIFSSCATSRKCNLKFPCSSSKDSIYIKKLDTFKIVLPGDSVKIVTKVPCDNFELIQQNGRLTQSLKVVNGILSSYINVRPDTIYRFSTNTVTKIKEVPKTVGVKFIPKFWRFTGIVGICFIVLLIAYILYNLKKAIKI